VLVAATQFTPYHPKVGGPLTLELLSKITERECYQRKGFTKLIVAAYVGDKSLVNLLLEARLGHPSETDAKGRSAFWWGRRGWVPDIWVSYTR